jgi:hypothetical protein
MTIPFFMLHGTIVYSLKDRDENQDNRQDI